MNTTFAINPLKHILNSTDPLPAHPVSVAWFRESVQHWWASACTTQGKHVEENGVRRVVIVPVEPPAVPIGDGRLVKHNSEKFTLVHGSMSLELVIRQWVEDLPKDNSRFAEELEKSYRWQLLVGSWAEHHQQNYFIEDAFIQRALANDGLPSTPSVVAYTRARFSGFTKQEAPEPCRGGMLTTFYFCSHLGPVDLTRPVSPEYRNLLPDEIVQQVTVSANWVRKDFWDAVAKKTAEHSDWITELKHSLLPKTNHRTVGERSRENWRLRQNVANYLADKQAYPLSKVQANEQRRREEVKKAGGTLTEKEQSDVRETIRKEIEKQKKDPNRAKKSGK